jgi:adenosylcobinamide kinase/adenosylcobinamide-phosphate guanylyltransferase
MHGEIILVTGGIRSGKSAFAEGLAAAKNESVLYVATGIKTDSEMETRIEQHRKRRPVQWTTLEEPLNIVDTVQNYLSGSNSLKDIIIDSVDVWISNLILNNKDISPETLESNTRESIGQLINCCRNQSSSTIIVSSEVGLSLVSPNALARQFQDLLGISNQQIALSSDKVYLVVSGLPLEISNIARNQDT